MAVELSRGSIMKLYNCVENVNEQIVLEVLFIFQDCGTIGMPSHNTYHYRLHLSDGVHVYTSFFINQALNYLIEHGYMKVGSKIQINAFKYIDIIKRNDYSPRWAIYIDSISIVNRSLNFSISQLLVNQPVIKPLKNLNFNDSPCRIFFDNEQLANNLINIIDMKHMPKGIVCVVLKLTLIKKNVILQYGCWKMLTMVMGDSTGQITVKAYNSLSIHMDKILEENKTYFITDFVCERKLSVTELTLAPFSVIIKCPNVIPQQVQNIEAPNFLTLLQNQPDTICDLIGLCIEFGVLKTGTHPTTKEEMDKRKVVLVDASLKMVTLEVWGEDTEYFEDSYEYPPVVVVKKAVLKVNHRNNEKYFLMEDFTEMTFNANTEKGRELENWYEHMVTNTRNFNKVLL